ncbi:MAG TPA: hypothetical protein PKD54_04500, partial [Pirellulaceae bacterium]|nr:hypothetical protein [Pirellulaceae bacterium]
AQNELDASDRQGRDQKNHHTQESATGPHSSPTATPESGNASFASGGMESLAKQRGSNWAIPSAQGVNYRRPVRVICAADHIVVSGGRSVVIEPTRIDFEGDVHQAVEPLVSYVNTLIQSWGPPPPDGHWRPELRVTVVGEAHPTAQRLAAYLRDSGLEFVGDRP